MADWNHVVVREDRFGRDRTLVTDAGGEILHEFKTTRMYDLGDRLTLPDGVEVVVIGDDFTLHEMNSRHEIVSATQVLKVGDVWSVPS